MPDNTKTNHGSLFPLVLSGFLVVLISLAAIIRLKLQNMLFISVIDLTGFHAFLVILVLLCFFWLLILCFESFSLSFGRLYKPIKWILFFVYYPLTLVSIFLLRISKVNLQTSFLAFQNQLFLTNYKPASNPEVLILLPHCLQYHDCKVRITRDIKDCEECGMCSIKDLKQLGNKYDIKIGIANGGTLARKIVHDNHPDVIVAVACHRDLTDGVRESWKYPVYAILNERPNGPCFDTFVDISKVKSIIGKIFREHETHQKD